MEPSSQQTDVERVMAVVKTRLLDQSWSEDEVALIRSLDPSALAEVQQRCLARSRRWKKMARLIFEIAMGLADVKH
jgi:hypothetical protein